MSIRQWHISTIVAAMLLTLFLLLGGQWLYNKYYVKDGLDMQVAKVAAVDSLSVVRGENPPSVYIHISHVKDLQTDYRGLANVVHKQLGGAYRVVLTDERTPRLQSLYEQCSFAIQEAIATGNFRSMQQEVLQLAAADGIQSGVSVDSDNVYLELRDKEGAGYLYEVIPRQSQLAVNGRASQGGEES